MIVRKVKSEDFSQVYPLLKEFNNARLQKEDWQRLFQNHWNLEDAYHGYLLEDNEKVVGYLGAIFSERWVNEKKQLFCNLTSWIVTPEYRGNGQKLLQAVIDIPDCTIVNLTASDVAAAIYRKRQFTVYETKTRKIFKCPQLQALLQPVEVLDDPHSVLSLLSEEEKKLYEDHKAFNCKGVLLKSKDDYCLLIITTRGSKAKIHYVSNRETFRRLIKSSLFKLCKKLKVNSLQIDERFLENMVILGSVKKKLPQPKFYRSDAVTQENIDELYTELLLLG